MKYSIPKVQKSLISLVRSLSQADVAKSPEKDFSRKRRCTLSDTITMAGHSLRKELDDYFLSNSRSLPSVSAFVQQRAKLSPDAFPRIFRCFNNRLPFTQTYRGLHFIACDGLI